MYYCENELKLYEYFVKIKGFIDYTSKGMTISNEIQEAMNSIQTKTYQGYDGV